VSHTGLVIHDRYRLDARIAAGGVGQVWRAADLILERPVAVKLLRPEYADHPETLARFRAEARHAGSLSHPAIAQVYDYGEAGLDHSPYLVMELVDGPSLAEVLARGPLDPVRTAHVVAQAAAALDAAHRVGLVHRDVKPLNILLGPGNRVKVTDFGIAHAAGSAPLTGNGIVMGTPAYLAPERAAGAPGLPLSDLYSLGIVAYECLTGAPPFDGTPAEVMGAHLHRPLPPLPAGVPPSLADLVTRLTAKNPAARPAAASAVAAVAGRLRDGLNVRSPQVAERIPAGFAIPSPAVPSPALAGSVGGRLASRPIVNSSGSGAWAPDGHAGIISRAGNRVRPGRRRRSGAMAVGAVAAVVMVGLAGWAVPRMFPSAPAREQAAGPQASAPVRTPGGSPGVRVVQVSASSLEGKALIAVLEELRGLGLNPLVQWARSGILQTGTVIGVTPGGSLTAGSTVIVTAAFQSAGSSSGTKSGKSTTGTRSSGGSGNSSGSGGSGGTSGGGGLLPLPGIGIGIGIGIGL